MKQEAMIEYKIELDEIDEERLLEDNMRENDEKNSATNGRRNRRKLKSCEDNKKEEGNWNIL